MRLGVHLEIVLPPRMPGKVLEGAEEGDRVAATSSLDALSMPAVICVLDGSAGPARVGAKGAQIGAMLGRGPAASAEPARGTIRRRHRPPACPSGGGESSSSFRAGWARVLLHALQYLLAAAWRPRLSYGESFATSAGWGDYRLLRGPRRCDTRGRFLFEFKGSESVAPFPKRLTAHDRDIYGTWAHYPQAK